MPSLRLLEVAGFQKNSYEVWGQENPRGLKHAIVRFPLHILSKLNTHIRKFSASRPGARCSEEDYSHGLLQV